MVLYYNIYLVINICIIHEWTWFWVKKARISIRGVFIPSKKRGSFITYDWFPLCVCVWGDWFPVFDTWSFLRSWCTSLIRPFFCVNKVATVMGPTSRSRGSIRDVWDDARTWVVKPLTVRTTHILPSRGLSYFHRSFNMALLLMDVLTCFVLSSIVFHDKKKKMQRKDTTWCFKY